ncbi:hemerythrin-like metal-binding domain protein [Formivibrio citricus]|uniref:histidine kinase n=1 Tax=Formivibrio citricus TaxID=83765 RepID=A0A1I4Y8G8_9NEIS|nr:bacteriohemerythrin [Formivibrio citricus]SFN33810.1 hemerythrin-like metal-binding domain protein [Formivibrio citricus]
MTDSLFNWDTRFDTGFAEIDQQHRYLFELVNKLHALTQRSCAPDEYLRILDALTQYAIAHFGLEDSIMRSAGCDPFFVDEHRHEHGLFIRQLSDARAEARSSSHEHAGKLLQYLLSWLTYHVLDMDQRMARQVIAIQHGTEPHQALLQTLAPPPASAPLLLDSLRRLHAQFIGIKENLQAAKNSLKQEVAKRTEQLVAANQSLQEELEKQHALLLQLEKTQEQLLQQEKLAAIGQLAAGVAHEINNPVGFVNSNLGSLRSYVVSLLKLLDEYEAQERFLLPETPGKARLAAIKKEIDLPFLRQDVIDLLNESEEGLERVKKIVQDLKGFARTGETQWQDVDLHQGLESTINVAWNEIKYKAELDRQYGKLPPVHCIPAQINQVFMNLLVNAAQSIDGMGRITLRTWQEGERVCIEISDNGKGMSPEILARIFEPFYTTKPAGQGTGLGLPLSREIVHKHGGAIEVDSTEGKGTRFRVWLPVTGPANGTSS